MAYNYDKFDKSITELVKENNIQSSTDYLWITSLNGVLQLENCQHQL